ncbi:hypothetical protein Pcinc_044280 [Petrolisthes cinctipes]|uniref:Uncharacterized protein n=1 Tax=Petrolisthes cinctipes TaxID=88211 RepID=A0AAE1BG48_PETCI|nr:hypothetical protein Pcinc_044280 [Petrolisthes cinctipes]
MEPKTTSKEKKSSDNCSEGREYAIKDICARTGRHKTTVTVMRIMAASCDLPPPPPGVIPPTQPRPTPSTKTDQVLKREMTTSVPALKEGITKLWQELDKDYLVALQVHARTTAASHSKQGGKDQLLIGEN